MEEKKKRIVPIIISIIAVIIVVIGASYAWFTLTIEGTKTNTLRVGNLALTLDDESSVGIHDENALPMLDEDGETLDPYHFTLKNEGSVPSDYTIYLDDDALDEGEERIANSKVKYQLDKNGEKTKGLPSSIENETTRILDSGKIKGNSTNTYDLRLWLDENVTSESSGQVFKGKIRIGAVQTTGRNKNIISIYHYSMENETKCLTGEETTCIEIKGSPETYEPGTIVKYKVNDTKEKYFHVISDNGDTLTMQQRENTINATAWYSTKDGTKGPLTVLPALESVTAGWMNILDQTYTLGETVLKENAFTGCNYDNTTKEITCTTNTYNLPSRTAKARMITAQEASSLGCKYGVYQSCPNWMNNYLSNSTSYGGTVNGTDNGYWMISVQSLNVYALLVNSSGGASRQLVTDTQYGARAVVMIDK